MPILLMETVAIGDGKIGNMQRWPAEEATPGFVGVMSNWIPGTLRLITSCEDSTTEILKMA